MPLDRPRRLASRLAPFAGLAALAALWAGTMHLAEPAVRAALEARAGAVSGATGAADDEAWLRVDVLGRDLVARGEAPAAPEREAALARLAALPGVRRVVDRTGLVGEAAPFTWTARRRAPERIDLLGARPAEIRRDGLAARLAAALPPGLRLHDEARAARGGPPGFADAAAYAVALVARLVPGGSATLSDGVLALEGETPDPEADAALRAALAAPPPGLRLGSVAVLPPVVRPFAWSLAREPDGGLAVAGFVASAADRRAVLAALAADGAPVRDGQRLGRGLDPAVTPGKLAEAALAVAALLREGRVVLDDDRLSVRGDAVDAQAVGEIEALVARGLPPGLRPGTVAVAARPPVPYRVALRRGGDAVTLTGHLPDAEARDALLAALRPRLFGERVVDRTRLAEGAPAGLGQALAAGLDGFVLLASGELAAEDRTLRLSGESLYGQTAERLGTELPARVPSGWRAEVSVAGPAGPARLDPEACRARFAAEVAPRHLRFPPGAAELGPGFYPVLDALAALVKACPGSRVAVAGHRDPPGARPPEPKPEARPESKPAPAKPSTKPAAKGRAAAPETTSATANAGLPDLGLPDRRARAVLDYLLQAGVPADRAAVVPAGEALAAEAPAGEARAVEGPGDAVALGFRP